MPRAVLAAASAVPAIWLLQNGLLFNPAAVDFLDAAGVGRAVEPISTIIAVSVAIIAGWDVVDGFRRAYLSERSRSAVQA